MRNSTRNDTKVKFHLRTAGYTLLALALVWLLGPLVWAFLLVPVWNAFTDTAVWLWTGLVDGGIWVGGRFYDFGLWINQPFIDHYAGV